MSVSSSSTTSATAITDAFGGALAQVQTTTQGPVSLEDNFEYHRNLVKTKEDELKDIQQQIESYDNMFKQLVTQKKMAVKKLADMDVQIKELNKQIKRELAEVESKEKQLQEKRSQLQIEHQDQHFDPFAGSDPFEGEDPFKSENINVTLPEDDPFNPASSTNPANTAFTTLSQNDPFSFNPKGGF